MNRLAKSSEPYIPADGSAPASVIIAATEQAFLVAKDAAHNLIDFIDTRSMWAFRTLSDCEKELDHIERTMDTVLPKAITHVGENRARELLACSRVITELERITDLVTSTALHLRRIGGTVGRLDRRDLLKMASTLQQMLVDLHDVMKSRNAHALAPILKADSEIDKLRGAILRRHIQSSKAKNVHDPVAMLFAAQALERAGDQATNIAEEAYRLIEGGTLRHLPPKEKRTKLGE
ncbi:MAG: phosphate signaling complex PhoU family protein [Terriglobales bacterium]